MIYLTAGLPGAGKTLFTIAEVKARAEKEKRPVFYSGIAGLALPWTKLDDAREWYKCPHGAIIVVDECQSVFPVRGKGAAVPVYVDKFSTHRHLGHDIYLISQDAMQFDHFVRRLVGVYWHVVRPFGMQYATVWQFEQVQPFNAKEAAAGFYDKITTKRRFDYPKEIFDVYKSAEVHTHKRRLPWRKLVLLGSLISLVAVAGFVAWRTVRGVGGHAIEGIAGVEKGKDDKKGLLAGGNPFVPVSDKKGADHPTLQEWLALRKSRVVALPESKPLYDALTEPLTFPRISICATRASSKGCWCWTQQATLIAEVPEGVCRNFIAFGNFDEHRSVSEDTGSGAGGGSSSSAGSGSKSAASTDSASPLTGASAQGGGVKGEKGQPADSAVPMTAGPVTQMSDKTHL